MVVSWNKQIRSDIWGSRITNDADCKDDAKTCLSKSMAEVATSRQNLEKQDNKHEHTTVTDEYINVTNSNVCCEAWTLKTAEERCIEGFEHKCIRSC